MADILKRKEVEKIKHRLQGMLNAFDPQPPVLSPAKQKELFDLCVTCLFYMDRAQHGEQMGIFGKGEK